VAKIRAEGSVDAPHLAVELFAKRELGEKIVDAMRHRMEHYLSLGVDLGRSTTWRDAIR